MQKILKEFLDRNAKRFLHRILQRTDPGSGESLTNGQKQEGECCRPNMGHFYVAAFFSKDHLILFDLGSKSWFS